MYIGFFSRLRRASLRATHSARRERAAPTRLILRRAGMVAGIFSLRAEKRRVSCCGVWAGRATGRTRAAPRRNQPRRTGPRLMRKTKPLISSTLIRRIYRVSLLGCGDAGRRQRFWTGAPNRHSWRRITAQWRFICARSGRLWVDVYLSQPRVDPCDRCCPDGPGSSP